MTRQDTQSRSSKQVLRRSLDEKIALLCTMIIMLTVVIVSAQSRS